MYKESDSTVQVVTITGIKSLWFPDVFRGYRKRPVVWNTFFYRTTPDKCFCILKAKGKKAAIKKKTFKKTEEAATGGVLQEKLFLEITQNS